MTVTVAPFSEHYARFSRSALKLEAANAKITSLLRDESIARYELLELLTPAFEDRVDALRELVDSEASLHATQPNGMEFGYSHESNLNSTANGFDPINPDSGASPWFGTLTEALAAKANDLRWNLPTFIVTRPKPLAPQRLGVAAS